MPLPEELEFELEALRATYGEDAVAVSSPVDGAASSNAAAATAATVSLPVAPRDTPEHACFVTGRLVLAVGAGYPAEAPGVTLADAKGALGWGDAVLRCSSGAAGCLPGSTAASLPTSAALPRPLLNRRQAWATRGWRPCRRRWRQRRQAWRASSSWGRWSRLPSTA